MLAREPNKKSNKVGNFEAVLENVFGGYASLLTAVEIAFFVAILVS